MNDSKKIIPIFVPHRGCPNDCVFCNQKKITGKASNNINKNYVIDIIESYSSTRSKYSDLAYFGGSFTAIDLSLQMELLEIAYHYKKKGFFDNIRISTRPDAINDEILEIQKRYGVTIIELGIQSMDDEVLKMSNRGHSMQDSIKSSKMIKDYGFILGHQIMPGLPGSNTTKDIETCKKSIELKPDIARIYPTLVIKETELENMYKENKYKPLSLEDAVWLSAKLYSLYTVNNINVIRIGLQNTDTINEENDVLAGPFHPAFRQLVEERLYLNSIADNLEVKKLKDDITIKANKNVMSYVVGHGKRNINFINNVIGLKRIHLQEIEEKDVVEIYDGLNLIAKIKKEDMYNDFIKYFY